MPRTTPRFSLSLPSRLPCADDPGHDPEPDCDSLRARRTLTQYPTRVVPRPRSKVQRSSYCTYSTYRRSEPRSLPSRRVCLYLPPLPTPMASSPTTSPSKPTSSEDIVAQKVCMSYMMSRERKPIRHLHSMTAVVCTFPIPTYY